MAISIDDLRRFHAAELQEKKPHTPSKETLEHRARLAAQTAADAQDTGYDYDTAKMYGLGPDASGHWPSRVPQTGQLLKGPGHPTYLKTLQGEKAAGYDVKRGPHGERYSTPKSPAMAALEQLPSHQQFRESIEEKLGTQDLALEHAKLAGRQAAAEATHQRGSALFFPETGTEEGAQALQSFLELGLLQNKMFDPEKPLWQQFENPREQNLVAAFEQGKKDYAEGAVYRGVGEEIALAIAFDAAIKPFLRWSAKGKGKDLARRLLQGKEGIAQRKQQWAASKLRHEVATNLRYLADGKGEAYVRTLAKQRLAKEAKERGVKLSGRMLDDMVAQLDEATQLTAQHLGKNRFAPQVIEGFLDELGHPTTLRYAFGGLPLPQGPALTDPRRYTALLRNKAPGLFQKTTDGILAEEAGQMLVYLATRLGLKSPYVQAILREYSKANVRIPAEVSKALRISDGIRTVRLPTSTTDDVSEVALRDDEGKLPPGAPEVTTQDVQKYLEKAQTKALPEQSQQGPYSLAQRSLEDPELYFPQQRLADESPDRRMLEPVRAEKTGPREIRNLGRELYADDQALKDTLQGPAPDSPPTIPEAFDPHWGDIAESGQREQLRRLPVRTPEGIIQNPSTSEALVPRRGTLWRYDKALGREQPTLVKSKTVSGALLNLYAPDRPTVLLLDKDNPEALEFMKQNPTRTMAIQDFLALAPEDAHALVSQSGGAHWVWRGKVPEGLSEKARQTARSLYAGQQHKNLHYAEPDLEFVPDDKHMLSLIQRQHIIGARPGDLRLKQPTLEQRLNLFGGKLPEHIKKGGQPSVTSPPKTPVHKVMTFTTPPTSNFAWAGTKMPESHTILASKHAKVLQGLKPGQLTEADLHSQLETLREVARFTGFRVPGGFGEKGRVFERAKGGQALRAREIILGEIYAAREADAVVGIVEAVPALTNDLARFPDGEGAWAVAAAASSGKPAYVFSTSDRTWWRATQTGMHKIKGPNLYKTKGQIHVTGSSGIERTEVQAVMNSLKYPPKPLKPLRAGPSGMTGKEYPVSAVQTPEFGYQPVKRTQARRMAEETEGGRPVYGTNPTTTTKLFTNPLITAEVPDIIKNQAGLHWDPLPVTIAGETYHNPNNAFIDIVTELESRRTNWSPKDYKTLKHILRTEALAQNPRVLQEASTQGAPLAHSVDPDTRAALEAKNRADKTGLQKTLFDSKYTEAELRILDALERDMGPIWEWKDTSPHATEVYNRMIGETLGEKTSSTGVQLGKQVPGERVGVRKGQPTPEVRPPPKIVYTDTAPKEAARLKKSGKGIDTLRKRGNQHYGNPFSHLKTPTRAARSVKSRDAAVEAYRDWLWGNAYTDLEPERRAWIIEQVENGVLDDATLIYYTAKRPNHAEVLAEFVAEWPRIGSRISKTFISPLKQRKVRPVPSKESLAGKPRQESQKTATDEHKRRIEDAMGDL